MRTLFIIPLVVSCITFSQSAWAELAQIYGCQVTSIKLTELLSGQPRFYNQYKYDLSENDFLAILIDFSEEDISVGAKIVRSPKRKPFPYSDLKTKFDPRNETTKQHLPGVFFTRDMTLMSSEQIYLHDTRYHLNLAKYSKIKGKWHGHITEFHREMIHTVTLDCEIQNNGNELNRMLYILSCQPIDSGHFTKHSAFSY